MNITCYECGQAGHIRTNCPHLTKVRTAAVRADGTEDPEMDPQEDNEALPPDKEGEGDSSEHQEEQLDVHMEPQCQGTTCFPLQKHLRVFPTPTLDTFGILRTLTASEFQRHFGVLLIPSPFQQSPTLLCTVKG